MVWSIVALEAVIFTALFSALVLIPSIKHPEAGVHNYPPEIQEEYFKTHPRVPTADARRNLGGRGQLLGRRAVRRDSLPHRRRVGHVLH